MHTLIQKRSIIGLITLAVVASALLSVLFLTRPSAAISGWNAGRIISDSVFTNRNSMSPGSIQGFLNSKVPSCDTWGTQPSEFGGGTRRQWAESRGYSAPFTCLRDYRQGGKSAAQIIYDTAQEFTINPQVLVVLLQKEQSLVTDTWPLSIQYRSATGYGCPDTAACDSEYYGFTNQVRWAARMFRAILNDSPSWYTPYELGTNFIRYSPDASCGGSNVNIQNRATQALYNYTPYQPNQAALNAGWGTVHCGAYGNRNFFLYFTSWFGSTTEQYKQISPDKWMRVETPTRKVNLWTREEVGSTLADTRQLKFADKLWLDGHWYYRTVSDRAHNVHQGVPLADLEEIPYTNMSSPRWMSMKVNIHKRDPRTGKGVDGTLAKGRALYFESQTVIDGVTFYRTAADTNNAYHKGVPTSALEEVPFKGFSDPRWLQTAKAVTRVNPRTGATVGSSIPSGTQFNFTSKMVLGGKSYYRTAADTTGNTTAAIAASDLEPIPYTTYRNGAYCLQMKAGAKKVDPRSGRVLQSLATGRQICFAQQITVNGVTYYRTESDKRTGADKGVPASQTEEVPFRSFSRPRYMKLTRNATKFNPKSGQSVDSAVAKSTRYLFNTKVQIRGVWYFRTSSDTTANVDKAFKESDLVSD